MSLKRTRTRGRIADDEAYETGADFAPRGGRGSTSEVDKDPSDRDEEEPYGSSRFAEQLDHADDVASPPRAGRSLSQLPTSARASPNKKARQRFDYGPSPRQQRQYRSRSYVVGVTSSRGRSKRECDEGYEHETESSDSESERDDGHGETSHIAMDTAMEIAKERQSRKHGLGISPCGITPEKLELSELFDYYVRFLAAALVLPDSGASVLRDMPACRDTRFWGAVCRRIEPDIATRLSGFAASTAWLPGVRAAIDLLPFFSFSEGVDDGSDCEACGRRNHPASFVVRMYGPVVNSAALASLGEASTTDWSRVATPAPAAAHAASASVGSLSAHSARSFWTDHIPRGSHAVYAQEFYVGRFCRQRLQLYAAMRHYKYRLLLCISKFLRYELALKPRHSVPSPAPSWFRTLFLRHVDPASLDDYDYTGEEDVDAVDDTFVSAIRVAIDFLDGRRAYHRKYRRGHDAFPGGHETKAIRSIKNGVLTATRMDNSLQGVAFWMQFRDVGPVIGGEIADFFHSFGLTDAHANKTDCSHRYDHGLRSPNWTRIGGTWRHTPNKVSRKASLWLIGASGLVADDVAVNNRSGPRSTEDIETRETAVFAKQAAVTFSLSVHRRAFLQMHETDLFTMAKDRVDSSIPCSSDAVISATLSLTPQRTAAGVPRPLSSKLSSVAGRASSSSDDDIPLSSIMKSPSDDDAPIASTRRRGAEACVSSCAHKSPQTAATVQPPRPSSQQSCAKICLPPSSTKQTDALCESDDDIPLSSLNKAPSDDDAPIISTRRKGVDPCVSSLVNSSPQRLRRVPPPPLSASSQHSSGRNGSPVKLRHSRSQPASAKRPDALGDSDGDAPSSSSVELVSNIGSHHCGSPRRVPDACVTDLHVSTSTGFDSRYPRRFAASKQQPSHASQATRPHPSPPVVQRTSKVATPSACSTAQVINLIESDSSSSASDIRCTRDSHPRTSRARSEQPRHVLRSDTDASSQDSDVVVSSVSRGAQPSRVMSYSDELPPPDASLLPRSPHWRREVLPLFESRPWRDFVKAQFRDLEQLLLYSNIFASMDDKSVRVGAVSGMDDLSFLAARPADAEVGTEALIFTCRQRDALVKEVTDAYPTLLREALSSEGHARTSVASSSLVDGSSESEEDEEDEDEGDSHGASSEEADSEVDG